MSIIKAIRAQLGLSNTASQNFTLDASASDGTMKLARGNAGATTQDILSIDASGIVSANQGIHGHLFQTATQNSTSGTSIDFTGIPSWTKRIQVVLNGVSGTGTSIVLVQLGSSSGGIEAASYNGIGCNSGAGGAASWNTASYTAGFGISASAPGTSAYTAIGTLVNQTGNTWAWNSQGFPDGVNITLSGTGKKTLSSTLDRVRIALSTSAASMAGSDTFDAGTITLVYEG